jgi:hypothetical protein
VWKHDLSLIANMVGGLVIHSAWLSFGADASGGGQESGVDADASDFGKFQRLNQEKKVRDQTDAEVSNALHMLSHIMLAVPGFWAYANGASLRPTGAPRAGGRAIRERAGGGGYQEAGTG